jgi:hypothetical protein
MVCAYANGLPILVEGLDVIIRTSAANDIMAGRGDDVWM